MFRSLRFLFIDPKDVAMASFEAIVAQLPDSSMEERSDGVVTCADGCTQYCAVSYLRTVQPGIVIDEATFEFGDGIQVSMTRSTQLQAHPQLVGSQLEVVSTITTSSELYGDVVIEVVTQTTEIIAQEGGAPERREPVVTRSVFRLPDDFMTFFGGFGYYDGEEHFYGDFGWDRYTSPSREPEMWVEADMLEALFGNLFGQRFGDDCG